MKKTIIKVPHTVRQQIMYILDVSYPTVRKALNGYSNTDLAKKIRKVALEKGGVELEIKKTEK